MLIRRGIRLNLSQTIDQLLDDEALDIHEEVQNIPRDSDEWLNQPNGQLGG